MTKSKLVRVLDDMTDMIFLVTKFDEGDKELLSQTGWDLDPKLTLLTVMGPKVHASMSTFSHPAYDLQDRGNIKPNGTTTKFSKLAASLTIEELPEKVDLESDRHEALSRLEDLDKDQ